MLRTNPIPKSLHNPCHHPPSDIHEQTFHFLAPVGSLQSSQNDSPPQRLNNTERVDLPRVFAKDRPASAESIENYIHVILHIVSVTPARSLEVSVLQCAMDFPSRLQSLAHFGSPLHTLTPQSQAPRSLQGRFLTLWDLGRLTIRARQSMDGRERILRLIQPKGQGLHAKLQGISRDVSMDDESWRQ